MRNSIGWNYLFDKKRKDNSLDVPDSISRRCADEDIKGNVKLGSKLRRLTDEQNVEKEKRYNERSLEYIRLIRETDILTKIAASGREEAQLFLGYKDGKPYLAEFPENVLFVADSKTEGIATGRLVHVEIVPEIFDIVTESNYISNIEFNVSAEITDPAETNSDLYETLVNWLIQEGIDCTFEVRSIYEVFLPGKNASSPNASGNDEEACDYSGKNLKYHPVIFEGFLILNVSWKSTT